MRTAKVYRVAKRGQPEAIIKRHILQYLSMQPEFFGFVVYNGGIYDPVSRCFRARTGFGHRKGVSDIIGMWNAQGFAIEIKTPTGSLRPEQKLFQQDFIKAGGLAITVSSVEEIVDWVAAMRIVTAKAILEQRTKEV